MGSRVGNLRLSRRSEIRLGGGPVDPIVGMCTGRCVWLLRFYNWELLGNFGWVDKIIRVCSDGVTGMKVWSFGASFVDVPLAQTNTTR
jgi:hypothetical protein